jgi:predicted HTH domain antitoxin
MQITLNIPDQYISTQNQSQISKQIKLYTALLMFQSGQLSRGAACEFAEMTIYDFLNACKQYNISLIHSSAQAIEDDVLRFEQRRKK